MTRARPASLMTWLACALHARRALRTLRTGGAPFAAWAVLLLSVGADASPRPADDYYHGAAALYVAGKIQEASVETEEGLRMHPQDAKLRMLAEHLQQMKDQQRGNPDQGDGTNEKDKQQDPQNGNSGSGERSDPRDGDGDGEKEGEKEGENPDDRNGEGGNQNQPDRTPSGSGENPDDGEGLSPSREQPQAMSEAEAERLLNSFADDEKKEQAERRKVIRSRAGTEQDW